MHGLYERWKHLFLFCAGLLLAASFTMKWIENDLVYNGEKISILGLELFYSRERIESIFTNMNDHLKTIFRYHLTFDFVFMVGCFPGIAGLCMMAREKTMSLGIQRFLLLLASLQLVAWTCDIIENCCLLYWLDEERIGSHFDIYHVAVAAKWIIAIAGLLSALVFLWGKTRRLAKNQEQAL